MVLHLGVLGSNIYKKRNIYIKKIKKSSSSEPLGLDA